MSTLFTKLMETWLTSRMNSEEIRTAAIAGARHVAELERALAEARERQDSLVVAMRRGGAPWVEIVAADGRSRQMLNRVYRDATEKSPGETD